MPKHTKIVEYTSDIFKREMAKPGWYNGLEGVKPSAANMLKKRFFEDEDHFMTNRMVNKLMDHFGYVIKEKRREALWEKENPKKWHVKHPTKDCGIIEAMTEEQAKEIATKAEYPRKKVFTDPFGQEHNLQDLFRCKLIAEEVK